DQVRGGSWPSEPRVFRAGERSRSELVRPTGLEPVAYGSGGRRSIQLSYGRDEVQSAFALRASARQPPPGPSSRDQSRRERRLVRPEGVEPPAYRFEACRSIQLSYGRTIV